MNKRRVIVLITNHSEHRKAAIVLCRVQHSGDLDERRANIDQLGRFEKFEVG
ncbi:MAG: hypothetical protein SFU91_02610 [Chloroherpetonaceae bacterium]|nr:hypothetical protein [Chloroherpetonaceae bacterium]